MAYCTVERYINININNIAGYEDLHHKNTRAMALPHNMYRECQIHRSSLRLEMLTHYVNKEADKNIRDGLSMLEELNINKSCLLTTYMKKKMVLSVTQLILNIKLFLFLSPPF